VNPPVMDRRRVQTVVQPPLASWVRFQLHPGTAHRFNAPVVDCDDGVGGGICTLRGFKSGDRESLQPCAGGFSREFDSPRMQVGYTTLSLASSNELNPAMNSESSVDPSLGA
jgi:hypothetical protein